jgi:hypothetical protein
VSHKWHCLQRDQLIAELLVNSTDAALPTAHCASKQHCPLHPCYYFVCISLFQTFFKLVRGADVSLHSFLCTS